MYCIEAPKDYRIGYYVNWQGSKTYEHQLAKINYKNIFLAVNRGYIQSYWDRRSRRL